MTPFQQVVVALLISIEARTYMPPLGVDSRSNQGAIFLATLACQVWIGVVLFRLAEGWAA